MKDKTIELLYAIKEAGGTPYVVGGYARDLYLGLSPKDVDIEVFGLSKTKLMEVIFKFGTPNLVGESFGIIKLNIAHGDDIDISLPRRESKSGTGHKGFIPETDSTMTPEEAALRRDFTMNAMYYDIFTDTIIDPFGGKQDLDNGIIKHTSSHFSEDPLRVLRMAQFCARFNLTPSPETLALAKDIKSEFHTLTPERILTEFDKLLMKGVNVSKGLRALQDSGWLSCFSTLDNLVGCPQEFTWHPEGDVWEHTLQVVDFAKMLIIENNIPYEDARVIMWSSLLHDVGKPSTTAVIDGKITTHGHDQTGASIARGFLEWLKMDTESIDKITVLIANHLAHVKNKQDGTFSKSFVRRLSLRLQPASLYLLSFVITADHSGRLPEGSLRIVNIPNSLRELMRIASEVDVILEAPKPHLMGRDLIKAGLKPSPLFGKIISASFEAQVEGLITDHESAIKWFEENKHNF